jgi:hypothetical protein
MIVNRFSGNPATYNIADIAQYYFTDATSTGANASVLVRNLIINPNPASEQLEPSAKRPAAQEKVKVESWKVGKLKVAPNSHSAMVNTNAMSALSLNMLNANY